MATDNQEDDMDFSKLKVPDLRKELKLRGLAATGNKNELLERLQASLKCKLDDTASAESVDDLDDDLLNDDDLDHEENIDPSEAVLNDFESHIQVSQSSKNKRKSEDIAITEQGKVVKKIVLNRNSSADDHSETEGNLNNVDNEKKIIKFSQLGAKDRLEMRAKKFGVPLSVEGRKAVRAERFNKSGDDSMQSAQTTSGSVDALKKRAERFGGSVSTVMSKLEMQERLEKRKERFGTAIAMNGSLSQSEKAKQRLERFKTST